MPAPAYFESLADTLVCVLTCGLVGGAVWLPWRLRPAASVFLSPLLGAAIFALLATLVGWSGHGFGTFPVRLVTLIIVAFAAWRQRGEVRSLARRAGLWMSFGTLASLPLLHQFWIAGSFNVFNDAFMYLVHAQWLQTHAFTEPSGASWEHPAWHQFKLSNWFSLAAISIAACLILSPTTRRFRGLITGLLALWCAAGLAVNLSLSSRRVTPFLVSVGVTSNPFGTYRALRDALRDIPPTEIIVIKSEIPV